MDNKQCHSLKEDKTRCANPTIGTSLHCPEHIKNAKKLYTKYKSVSEYIKSIDIHKHFDNDNEKVEYLKQYHSLLLETFFARFKHRYYTIAPECHDDGHNYQFVMLQNKLVECETAIKDMQIKHDKILLEVSKHIRSTEMTKENLMSNKFMILGMKYNMFKQNTLDKVLLKMNVGMWTPRFFKMDKKPVRDKNVLTYVLKMKKDDVKMLEGKEEVIKKGMSWNEFVECFKENDNVVKDVIDDDIPDLVPSGNTKPIKPNKKYEKQLKRLVVIQTKPAKKPKQKKGKKKEVVLPVKVEVKHIDRKTLLSESIVRQLLLIYDITIKDDVYIYLMCLTHLINELEKIKFLDDEFKPKMCEICDCDRVVTYDVSFNCDCYIKYKTIEDYFSSTGNTELKEINRILKTNFVKLKVLCMDVKELFANFRYSIFNMPLDLSWDYREEFDRYRVKFGGTFVSESSDEDDGSESCDWGMSKEEDDDDSESCDWGMSDEEEDGSDLVVG